MRVGAGPPPPKKSNTGLIIGVVVGVLVLVCGGGIGAFALMRNAFNEVADTIPSLTIPVDSPTDEQPTDDPAPTGETFEMAVGDGVQVVDGDTEWHVFIVDAQWFSRDALPNIPPKISIARKLIDAWLEGFRPSTGG